MNTQAFKTKSEIRGRISVCQAGCWPVGLDIGYSSIKGWAPNKIFCIPAYAKKIPEDRLTLKEPDDMDIQYEDESGRWVVGKLAYDEVIASEVIDNESELYGRNRYFSAMFKVLVRTGLAIAMMPNKFGAMEDRKLIVQTGLPPKYLKGDSEFLTDALCGSHKFRIKIGRQPWMDYDIVIEPDSVAAIMSQPLGAFVSASTGKDGMSLPVGKKYFTSNVLVFDPGFGTSDTYLVAKGSVTNFDTDSKLGMREIFSRTCRTISDVYGLDIQIAELQNYLDTGEVRVLDRKAMKRTSHTFEGFLKDASHDVMVECLDRMKSAYNYFSDVDYIIATGGTYDAWKDDFQELFKDMEGLTIIPANINEPSVPNIYSNVRGYYYQCVGMLSRRNK